MRRYHITSPKAVVATDPVTGDTQEFPSVAEAAARMCVARCAIRTAIRRRGTSCGYRWAWKVGPP